MPKITIDLPELPDGYENIQFRLSSSAPRIEYHIASSSWQETVWPNPDNRFFAYAIKPLEKLLIKRREMLKNAKRQLDEVTIEIQALETLSDNANFNEICKVLHSARQLILAKIATRNNEK